MNFDEFKKILYEECRKIDINLTETELNIFYKYMKGILEWNNKINLTAITDEKMFIVKHFVDSLTVNQFISDEESIIDVGTGAGFPGIPLKIVNKEKKFVLVDSINKKLNVIKTISENLNFDNLEIIHSRAEDLANKKEYREAFDVAITRAVSNFSTILEYMLPFIKISGIAICMKGPNYEIELEEGKKALEVLGGRLKEIKRINVGSEMERNIIIIEKIKNTPQKFPRSQGKPLKEPIR